MTDEEKLKMWDQVVANSTKMANYIQLVNTFMDDMQQCGKLTEEDFKLWTMKYEAKLTADKLIKT